jgi:glycosidase
MFSSLYAKEVQSVFDTAEAAAGQKNGPFPSPADWRDQVIYFLMVDRFNNPNQKPIHQPYDDPNFGQYQGGSFDGIKQQLPYIKSLGASAIWLSPVLKNLPWDLGCYHGYGIHDFLRANPKFATVHANADDELRALVDAAHAAGLYVIFDIVLNHTGDLFAYIGNQNIPYQGTPQPLPVQWRDNTGVANPAWPDVAAIPNPSPDSIVWPSEFQNNGYFRMRGQCQGNDTYGDFDSLKQLCTELPDVQRFLIRAYQYVMARYDIDGFRIDTLRYLKNNLAQTFGNSVREYGLVLGKKNFFTFGELLGDPESDFINFVGRDTQLGSDGNSFVGVDAALDYPLFSALVPTLKGFAAASSVTDMYNTRKQDDQYMLSSHGDASRYFVTFLDNHDMKKRFRWEQPGNPTQFDDQVSMGIACLYCLPGVPCVYYGTEQGLHGWTNGNNDPAVREALWGIAPTFPKTTSFYVQMQKIASIRNAEPALRYGRFYFRPVSGDGYNFGVSTLSNGILAWSRILNDEEVVIVANTNTTTTISVAVIVEPTLSTVGQAFDVLYTNKTGSTAPTAVQAIPQASVTEVDGSHGNGPLNVTRVTLLPMEVQILRM